MTFKPFNNIDRSFLGDNRKHILLNLTYILFVLSLVFQLARSFFKIHGYRPYTVSEFLINYQGGFVRRGLIGEILLFFAQKFNFDVEWAIKIFCLTCFIFVVVFFVRMFLKIGYSLYVLPLCFFLGCGILGNVFGDMYWIRKDYMFFCFFIPIVWLYVKDIPTTLKVLLINILAVFMILSHEAFVFFSIPILFLMFFSKYKKYGVLSSCTISSIYLFPSIIASLSVFIMHGGGRETAQTIWNSWIPILNLPPSPMGWAVEAISWTSTYGFMKHIYHNFLEFNDIIYPKFVWIIMLPVVYYIVTNALLVFRKCESVFTNNHKTVLSSVLIFQFICLSPMYLVLSCDYIRICFYWVASSFVVFLLVPINNIEKIFPTLFVKAVERINTFFTSILQPTKTNLVFLMLFVGIPSWGFTIERYYETTMLYNVLRFPSLFIQNLLHFILKGTVHY